MRLFVVSTVSLLLASPVAAQSRWTFSAGPEWATVAPHSHVWGMRLRAEYDLIKAPRVIGLRLEGAALWSPTQSWFGSNDFGYWGGTEQRTDLMLGISGSISPVPHARFSPYVTMGLYGRQQRIDGASYFSSPQFGSPGPGMPSVRSRGDIIVAAGLGLRMRAFGRPFQLEYRLVHGSTGMTLGTRLPF